MLALRDLGRLSTEPLTRGEPCACTVDQMRLTCTHKILDIDPRSPKERLWGLSDALRCVKDSMPLSDSIQIDVDGQYMMHQTLLQNCH